MCLYIQKNKNIERGVLRTPPPITFLAAVRVLFLSHCPKFSSSVVGGRRKTRGYKTGSDKDVDSADGGNIGIEKPLYGRPSGGSKRKIGEKVEGAFVKAAKSSDNITAAMRTSLRETVTCRL